MRKWHIPYIVGMLLVMVVVWFAVIMPISEKSPAVYEGKEVFRTEADYNQFKEVIGLKDVDIQSIVVLSSSPPIVVEFNVQVPYDMIFAYGDFKRQTGFGKDLFGWACYFLSWVMGIGLLSGIYLENYYSIVIAGEPY